MTKNVPKHIKGKGCGTNAIVIILVLLLVLALVVSCGGRGVSCRSYSACKNILTGKTYSGWWDGPICGSCRFGYILVGTCTHACN